MRHISGFVMVVIVFFISFYSFLYYTASMDMCPATTESQQFNIIKARHWTISLLSEGKFAGEYEIC